MTKKIIVVVILLGLAAAVFFGGRFYYNNLRGIKPALVAPSQNVSALIAANQSPLTVAPEYNIAVYADKLNTPRVIVSDPAGYVVVSEMGGGRVLAFGPSDPATGRASQTIVVAENLNNPHGLAFYCPAADKFKLANPASYSGDQTCHLYIAETDRVSLWDYNFDTHTAGNRRNIIDLPAGGVHTTRSLLIYNNQLLISIGSSCNVCRETDPLRATIYAANLDGTNFRPYATGLRNSVFMTVNSRDHKIWATEMGRDLLGDDLPPDEINIIEEGKNYGWPICYGQNIHDTDFDKNIYVRAPCMEPFTTPSLIDIPAHSAPLGLAFMDKGEGVWNKFANNLFVAYHGSWNRSVPTGYKVVRYQLNDQNQVVSTTDFITGFLSPDGTAVGRPVGILIVPGGVLYITDDKAGVIYMVSPK